jgi:hypothetical protein
MDRTAACGAAGLGSIPGGGTNIGSQPKADQPLAGIPGGGTIM